jgi:uncharacterized LabA/DUF88 family protein
MKIGLFIDSNNLYFCLNKKYGERKLSYVKYLDYVKSLGTVSVPNIYGVQVGTEANGFIYCLEKSGYNTIFKRIKERTNKADEIRLRFKINWNVGIAIDAMNCYSHCDLFVIGSNDLNLKPLIQYLCLSKKVLLLACGIPKETKGISPNLSVLEIPESLLE